MTAVTALNPRLVPVLRRDSHLPLVEPGRLSAQALRARFMSPPQWQPELVREPPWGGRSPTEAAVLLAVIQREEPMLLLTQRASHLASHSGQIAFPGGKVDASDTSPIGAALREAHEEVGLPPEEVEVLGCLPQYFTGSQFSVTPVLGLVRPGITLHPSPDEVADVFEVPLAFLMNPTHHRWHEWHDPAGTLRQWLSMPYQDGGQERYIWGATAGMLRNLYAFMVA